VASNQGFDYFRRGRVLATVAGTTTTAGLESFRRGQLLPVVVVPPAIIEPPPLPEFIGATATENDTGDTLTLVVPVGTLDNDLVVIHLFGIAATDCYWLGTDPWMTVGGFNAAGFAGGFWAFYAGGLGETIEVTLSEPFSEVALGQIATYRAPTGAILNVDTTASNYTSDYLPTATTPSVTTTAPGDLLIHATLAWGTIAFGPVTIAPPSGFTLPAEATIVGARSGAIAHNDNGGPAGDTGEISSLLDPNAPFLAYILAMRVEFPTTEELIESNDTLSLASSESWTILVTFLAITGSDSSAIASSAATTIGAVGSATDTGSLSVSETVVLADSLAISETVALGASESASITVTDVTVVGADSDTLTASEAASISVAVSSTDNDTMVASESVSLDTGVVQIASADSGTISSEELIVSLAIAPTTQVSTITSSDSWAMSAQLASADSDTITDIEAFLNTVAMSRADVATIFTTPGLFSLVVRISAPYDTGLIGSVEFTNILSPQFTGFSAYESCGIIALRPSMFVAHIRERVPLTVAERLRPIFAGATDAMRDDTIRGTLHARPGPMAANEARPPMTTARIKRRVSCPT